RTLSGPVEDVREGLMALHRWNLGLERAQGTLTWVDRASWLGGLLGVLGAVLTDDPVLWIAVGMAVVAFVLAFVLRWILGSVDARRIRLAQALVHELAVPPGSAVELFLNLGRPTEPRAKVAGRRIRRDRWLDASVPLADGSVLHAVRTEDTYASTHHEGGRLIDVDQFLSTDELAVTLPVGRPQPRLDAARLTRRGMLLGEWSQDARTVRLSYQSSAAWGADPAASDRGLLDVPAAWMATLRAITEADQPAASSGSRP
ncbi:MAG: hypothetical protein AAF211_07540, partial [Myxococcota bacterium]